LVRIAVSVDGELVARLRCDGVIVATPTGSTAYSLSAGGAVVHPEVPALLVTPICPHALNQRPMIVPQSSRIALTLEAGADPIFLTVDGQEGVALDAGDVIHCGLSPLRLRTISAARLGFYDNLRRKLGWG